MPAPAVVEPVEPPARRWLSGQNIEAIFTAVTLAAVLGVEAASGPMSLERVS